MNIKLLRQIQQVIRKSPTQFNMGDWITRHADETDHGAPIGVGKCGTACCIAGWATVLNGKRKLAKVPHTWMAEPGQRALDITDEQAGRLFWTQQWPLYFRDKYWKLSDAALQADLSKRCVFAARLADVACERIDHFIKTDGAE